MNEEKYPDTSVIAIIGDILYKYYGDKTIVLYTLDSIDQVKQSEKQFKIVESVKQQIKSDNEEVYNQLVHYLEIFGAGYTHIKSNYFTKYKLMKRYNEMFNIGKAKYVVNFHDGTQFHNDGSEFYDMRIFKNKVLKNKFVNSLIEEGYQYGSALY